MLRVSSTFEKTLSPKRNHPRKHSEQIQNVEILILLLSCPHVCECSHIRGNSTSVVVMLSKHFWRPGYCNPMHIWFQWCNRYDRHGNIRRCRLQRHTVCVCVCCFYPQHLRQTLGRSPAALAVGTDVIPLVTESHQRSAHFEKGHSVFYEYCCWPGGAFCIRSLRWLFLAFFHADGLTFQRLTRGTGTRHL